MNGYLIRLDYSNDFYLGKMYQYQGMFYPHEGKKEDAKVYKSLKVASKAAERLAAKWGGGGSCTVVQVVDGKIQHK